MNRAETPSKLLQEIVKEKHSLLKKIMEDADIDCWIAFMRETAANPDPVQNLVVGGQVAWAAAFIYHLKDAELRKIAIVGNFDVDAENAKGLWEEVHGYKTGITEILQKTMDKIDPQKIALNYSVDDVMADGLSHGLFLSLSNILQKYQDRFVSAEGLIRKIRSLKTKTEVNLVTEACILTEKINKEIQEKFRLGMTEIEIQNMYYEAMDNHGVIESWERSGCPAIDAGPVKEFGHVSPSELKIQRGHTLHNDFGVQLNGYCSDIQRMWFFGTRDEIPEELTHAFDTVHGAITRAAEFIKPGVKGYEVDKKARDYVLSRGYEEYDHGLGHQVGTKAHDGGVLLAPLWERYTILPKGEVEENNIFTLELYVKTKNYGWVSLEEDIVVTSDGCRFLVPRQEEWICVDIKGEIHNFDY